jgi:hypothetical protein
LTGLTEITPARMVLFAALEKPVWSSAPGVLFALKSRLQGQDVLNLGGHIYYAKLAYSARPACVSSYVKDSNNVSRSPNRP